MAVLKMERIDIIALKKQRRKILDTLQRMEVIEISAMKKNESDAFSPIDTSSKQTLVQKNLNLSNQALKILDEYKKEDKSLFASLEGKQNISVDDYYKKESHRDKILSIVNEINSLYKTIAESKAAKTKPLSQIEALEPWLSLDVALNYRGTKNTCAFIGTLPQEYTLEELLSSIKAQDPFLEKFDACIIHSSPVQTCVFAICLIKDKINFENALRSLGFSYLSNVYALTPVEASKKLREEMDACDNTAKEAVKRIVELSDSRRDIEYLSDYYKIQLERYIASEKLIASNNTFALEGYVLKKNGNKVKDYLEKNFDVAIELSDAVGEDVPVAIRNNPFAAPVEGVLESFSYPGRGEVDPTSIMAIFYYIFFGMMLADAGYGVIMTLGCVFAIMKFTNMDIGLKKTLTMFMYCGISTTFWGIMFGSYFGNAVDIISTAYFGKTLTIPALWFVPLNEPMRMLVYAMAFGLVHLTVGLFIGGYQALKEGDIKGFIYDTLFWFVLVYSLILMFLPSSLFSSMSGMSIVFPSWVNMAAKVLAVASAVGIILTSGRDSRNWFKRILKGLYGLYNISGWLSDVLSYSRLLALGLASGVIASVINEMGVMTGNSVIGIIAFILIFIFGHILNMAINLLGAYVHTNRLQFVEFFGKFYSGGGRKFTPFAAKTKYYNIREES